MSYYDDMDRPGRRGIGGQDVIPGKVIGTASALTDYHHGPPAAPTGLMAHDAGPDARRLVWDEGDRGRLMYELRYSSDPTDDDEWEDWDPAMSGKVIDDLDMGVEYTFEVRALRRAVPGLVTCTVRRQAPRQ